MFKVLQTWLPGILFALGPSGCLPGQFLCGDGKCVDRSAICNGFYDCIDAADERDCSELAKKCFYVFAHYSLRHLALVAFDENRLTFVALHCRNC